MGKKRLDVLLYERGMVESRQRAQALIMSGLVFMDDQRMDKAGMAVDESAELRIRGQELTYVSRGGLKLEKAMKTFPIRLQGAVCGDIGASTGGFTDCMLKTGRRRFTPWTWAMGSWPGSSAAIRGWSAWNGPTPAI